MRKHGSCVEKEIMQGTMPGARRRGRPCTAWMDNIKMWTGLSVEESVRMTEINEESMSMVWPTLGSRMAEEQNRTCRLCVCVVCLVDVKLYLCRSGDVKTKQPSDDTDASVRQHTSSPSVSLLSTVHCQQLLGQSYCYCTQTCIRIVFQ